ncbi:hypothetical protein GFL02_10665 [Pseudomonas stutzeri]|nr:hypothetical protein [Stutzerimonas frequens]
MKVGFLNVYPYRPHGHHARYLGRISKSIGWETYALVCDGNAEHCYLRELKGTGRSECAKCIVGGLRSFDFDQIDSAWRYWSKNAVRPEYETFVESSAYTLTRIESWDQRQSEVVADKKKILLPDSVNFYYATLRWIEHRKLDVVIAFNGRMDLTRAAIEACRTAGIPFVTHERPLFGHGLILNRNANCSSLEKIHRINQQYSAKSLSAEQCAIAAKLAAERLTGGNLLEWKRYNANADKTDAWPVRSAGPRVLVCPSSKNELLGHPDWATEWADNTDAIDIAVANGWFGYADILVRFHPSWSVKFGQVSAKLCEEHYQQWCESRGVTFIESSSKISTQDLIRMADVVVLNGSNTVFEAGILGKPVVCLGPSPYSYSGAATDILTIDDLESTDFDKVLKVDPARLISRTLRYFYSKAAREPVFVNFVRSKTVTECSFYEGADPQMLAELVTNGAELVDDIKFSDSSEHEDVYVRAFLNGERESLVRMASSVWLRADTAEIKLSRKSPYGLVDRVRGLSPKGV